VLAATRALTIFAEIDPARRASLDMRLATIAGDLEHNAVFRPSSLPDTHFTRFVIINDADHDHELPDLLAWEVNHDGSASDYLAAVARHAPAIDRVLEACVGYPGTHQRDAWLAWMTAHRHRSAAFYTGYRGIPRREVVNDRAVHDELRRIADRDRGTFETLPPHEIQRRLREAAKAGDPKLDLSPIPDEEWRWLLGKVAAIAALVVLLPVLVVIIGPWYLMLRRHERADLDTGYTRPVHDNGFSKAEDEQDVRQNQLTHVVDIKPGVFRLFTVWAVLTAIDALATVIYVRGELGGISSIHFARWVIVRDRRRVKEPRHRLVFFSNYDGSWESYLGEFIDRASTGLTAVWSNTVGFPRSKNLLWEGASDEEAFKQWTRDHQQTTQVWWSGVPTSTVQNVRDDVWLRRRLDQTLDTEEMARWLRLL